MRWVYFLLFACAPLTPAAAARALQAEDIAGKKFCWPNGDTTFYGRDGNYAWTKHSKSGTGTWRIVQTSLDGQSAILYTTVNGRTFTHPYAWEDGAIVKAFNLDRPTSAHAENGPFLRAEARPC